MTETSDGARNFEEWGHHIYKVVALNAYTISFLRV
jgi:hypothetical protein